MNLPKIAISVGDLNGVGIEIALASHKEISKICSPVYCINSFMLRQATKLLDHTLADDFIIQSVDGEFEIQAGKVDALSGKYSYDSFMKAIDLCDLKKVDALVTMPIHKEAWKLAGLDYVGHTDLLRKYFKKDAIMMLGCEEMFVALFTEHIPLRDVAKEITEEKLVTFFRDFYKATNCEKVAVLGLNPHAGDNGVLGDEEKNIESAIAYINKEIGANIFDGCIVPDVAFTPHFRKNYKYFIAMYHDQGLAPLKALYFEKSINISLNLPITRTSVDHGTAFDIAYESIAQNQSYINAIYSAINFSNKK